MPEPIPEGSLREARVLWEGRSGIVKQHPKVGKNIWVRFDGDAELTLFSLRYGGVWRAVEKPANYMPLTIAV